MISFAQSYFAASPGLSLEDFKQDKPYPHSTAPAKPAAISGTIDGVSVTPLHPHTDARGSLCELLTTREGTIEPIVHVYHITADGGSIRAWVYNSLQDDRLAFMNGRFRIVLYDIRPDSPTFGLFNTFLLGLDSPGLMRIPPFVIHGVQNTGPEAATFVNLPTKAWYPRTPDKYRLPKDDPRIPFNFDD